MSTTDSESIPYSEVIMTFGKYKGQPLGFVEQDKAYLTFICEKMDPKFLTSAMKTMLDMNGRRYRAEKVENRNLEFPNAQVMKQGKYAGIRLDCIPLDYYIWTVKNAKREDYKMDESVMDYAILRTQK